MSKAKKSSGKGAAVFLILWILLVVAGGVDAVTLSANNLPDHHHMVGDDDASFVGQGGGARAGAGISKDLWWKLQQAVVQLLKQHKALIARDNLSLFCRPIKPCIFGEEPRNSWAF